MLGKFENRLYLCDPCVGDHDIQGTQSLDGSLDEGFDFTAVGYIGYDTNGFAAEGVNVVDDLVIIAVRAVTANA